MNTGNRMVKYAVEAVLVVLEAADRPLTTAEIGERCREVDGRRRYVDRGPDEVADALKKLHKAGEVVTAIHGDGGEHQYICGAIDARSRWWATTGLAERCQQVRADAEARGEQARQAADGIRRQWEPLGLPGPAPHVTWDAPGSPYTGPATVTIALHSSQAAWLLDLLRTGSADTLADDGPKRRNPASITS